MKMKDERCVSIFYLSKDALPIIPIIPKISHGYIPEGPDHLLGGAQLSYGRARLSWRDPTIRDVPDCLSEGPDCQLVGSHSKEGLTISERGLTVFRRGPTILNLV